MRLSIYLKININICFNVHLIISEFTWLYMSNLFERLCYYTNVLKDSLLYKKKLVLLNQWFNSCLHDWIINFYFGTLTILHSCAIYINLNCYKHLITICRIMLCKRPGNILDMFISKYDKKVAYTQQYSSAATYSTPYMSSY